MPTPPAFARRIAAATATVFGDSPITAEVEQACQSFLADLENIHSGRGIHALLVAVVGAKGQGKTWVARQLIREPSVRQQLRSGDLLDDATTKLVWIGPVAPAPLNHEAEIYHPCPPEQMVDIGQMYVLLDTPGLTDANLQAAELAKEALSLAPIKLLVIARDQLRAACNLSIADQIDGSICIPIITSVEPDELGLEEDLRSLHDQLSIMAPKSELKPAVLVADFEISGDEAASERGLVANLLDCFHELGLNQTNLASAREQRTMAAGRRLRQRVHELISEQLPQLASAVEHLNQETEQLPERVLDSLLGSETVLQTGVRMRLRARLIGDTSLLWFPYRTIMSTLNLTQGAWDRVMLALTGSVPSLFGAMSSWARNVREIRNFDDKIQDGIRQQTQAQVEQRLRPLCDRFHRAVSKLRPREDRVTSSPKSSEMELTGIEELQMRSQQIFESTIDRHATKPWLVQIFAMLGVALFWAFMAGPIVLIYREYVFESIKVFRGETVSINNFPHPTASLWFTSLLLSVLPLAIYCMFILTWSLNRRKIHNVSQSILEQHEQTIRQLKSDRIIRLEFEDEVLQQANFLLTLREARSSKLAE